MRCRRGFEAPTRQGPHQREVIVDKLNGGVVCGTKENLWETSQEQAGAEAHQHANDGNAQAWRFA